MSKQIRFIAALMAIAATTAAAQSSDETRDSGKPLARYTIHQGREAPSLVNVPDRCGSDRPGSEMARHQCETCEPAEAVAGLLGDRSLRNPPLLLEHAFARIAAGEISGSYERVVDGVRHCVSWAAADVHNALIVETLWR